MNEFSIPENENMRLEALLSYDVLDTAPEVSFDEITELAAEILQCPVSFIEFMDADRQWFKSKYGLPEDYIETPRDLSICNTVICQGDLLCVPDLTDDERFRNNPMVQSAPNIRFYAGAPLITPNGQAIGTICTVDFEKRELSINQREALRKLSKQVMTQLELRRTLIDVNRLIHEQKKLSLSINKEKEKADKYMTGGYGALIGFELPGGKEAGSKFIDSLELLYHVANIGDSRSLAIHPATTTHSQLAPEEQVSAGVTPGYVRLSIGIENAEDIIADISQAIDKASK